MSCRVAGVDHVGRVVVGGGCGIAVAIVVRCGVRGWVRSEKNKCVDLTTTGCLSVCSHAVRLSQHGTNSPSTDELAEYKKEAAEFLKALCESPAIA